jgi:hypothetical protein
MLNMDGYLVNAWKGGDAIAYLLQANYESDPVAFLWWFLGFTWYIQLFMALLLHFYVKVIAQDLLWIRGSIGDFF